MKILMTPVSFGNPFQRELADALERLKHSVALSNPYLFWRFPFLKYIRINGKPDVVHLHWLDPYIIRPTIRGMLLSANITLFEMAIMRSMGIKLVWTVHNVLSHDKLHPVIEKTYLRIIMRFFNEIIFLSLSSITEFNKVFNPPPQVREKYHVVPHGHYISSYINKVDTKSAKNLLGIDEQSFVLLFFGEIRDYKGLKNLIRAFSELKDNDSRLVIAGKYQSKTIFDTMTQEILSASKSDKRIIPHIYFIPDHFVQVFMNAADLVVLPYSDILNSGAAILAMSFGKALIAPKIGSLTELLDEKGGVFFNPTEQDGLIKAIKKARTLNVKEMGKYNFEKIQRYDWDSIARETSEIYNSSFDPI